MLNILNMVYTLRFFSFLQNAVCFIKLTYLVPVLFTFYIQGVLKFNLKNNSGAKRLNKFINFIKKNPRLNSDLQMFPGRVFYSKMVTDIHNRLHFRNYMLLCGKEGKPHTEQNIRFPDVVVTSSFTGVLRSP